MRPNASLKGQAGFSLIEIMVALVLTTVMLGAAVPALSRYLRNHELLGWVENMAADMRLCRMRAAVQGNNFVLSWNTTNMTYTILDDRNSNGTADSGEPTIGPKQLPSSLTLTNGPSNPFTGTSVTFLPNGSTSQPGQLTLANCRGVNRTIQLLRPTGLVKIQ